MRKLLAAATLYLGLATPALASVELLPEQLDSVTAGVTFVVSAANAASMPGLVSTLQSQGWTVTVSGATVTAQLDPGIEPCCRAGVLLVGW
jgi:hypothetical protein